MKKITSLLNPEIKELYKLKKSRNRKSSNKFLIDGERELEIAISSGVKIEKIFICEELSSSSQIFIKKHDKNLITLVSSDVFKKLAYKEKPDGFLALAIKENKTLKNINQNKESIVLILEAVEKPGNLGAIIRTAYAAGLKTIILTENQTDVYNPNVIRSSEGMVFKLNIIESSSEDALSWLKSNKIKIYSTTIEKGVDYSKNKYESKSALVFGSEANGLSSFWLDVCDKKIKIPMAPNIDSLNVSVSVAIILFEMLRQKKEKK